MDVIFEDDNLIYSLSFSKEMKQWVTHVDLKGKKFTHQQLKKYKKLLKLELQKLRKKGITKVYGISESKKERHFNMIFGYVPEGILLTNDGLLNYLTVMET